MDVKCFFIATCVLLLSNATEGRLFGLRVNDITAHSARFRWKTGKGKEKVNDFRIHCSGVNHFVSALGENKTALHKRIQYAPQGLNHILLGGLLPNFVYSCNMTEEVDNHEHRQTKKKPNHRGTSSTKKKKTGTIMGKPGARTPVNTLKRRSSERAGSFKDFSTGYVAPEAPQAPIIYTNSDGDNITVELFPTSSKNGPISGYKVQFHVVERRTPYHIAALPLIQDELLDPFGPLNTQDMAQKTSHPVSFRISFSTHGTLPNRIPLGKDFLKGALKNGANYCVVTVAFTVLEKKRLKEKREVLYTPSKPSGTFTAIGQVMIFSKLLSHAQRLLLVVFGMFLPLALFVYTIIFAAFILYTDFLQPTRSKWAYSYKRMSPQSTSTGSHTNEKLEVESIDPPLDNTNSSDHVTEKNTNSASSLTYTTSIITTSETSDGLSATTSIGTSCSTDYI